MTAKLVNENIPLIKACLQMSAKLWVCLTSGIHVLTTVKQTIKGGFGEIFHANFKNTDMLSKWQLNVKCPFVKKIINTTIS